MKIPTSMATQHPDSASRYVPIQEEPDEALEALTPQPGGLGIEELMVDYEGKMTPYHQVAEIVHKLLAKNLVPGRDVWITPRISSATEETVFRQLMALMSIIEADYDIAKSGFEGGIRELILPMVKGAEEMLALRRRIADVIELAHKEFGLEKNPNALQLIPLIESVPKMLTFDKFYEEYFNLCGRSGFTNEHLRFMIGRSDTALSYGMIAAVLTIKIMIFRAYRLGESLGLQVAPILGGGALPFRGHITLENLSNVLADFAGTRTITVQSGLRYDHDPEVVKELVNRLKMEVQQTNPLTYTKEEEEFLLGCVAISSKSYLKKFSRILDLISALSTIVPQQRDRLTHRGAFGYGRLPIVPEDLLSLTDIPRIREEIKAVEMATIGSLPRVITYTAALYSVGLPPEFLGIGETLADIKEFLGADAIDRLVCLYPGLKADLQEASHYLNLEVVHKFLPADFVDDLERQIAKTETLLGIPLLATANKAYQTLLEIVEPLVRQTVRGEGLDAEDHALLRSCIIRLGKLRGSLG
jgi:phosphoenolpyruvate carboxylase